MVYKASLYHFLDQKPSVLGRVLPQFMDVKAEVCCLGHGHIAVIFDLDSKFLIPNSFYFFRF